MKKGLLLSALALGLFMGSALAQNLQFTRQIVKDLAAPEMYGRGYAYNGDSIAAEYLRNVMKQLKLDPVVPNYYQDYAFNSFGMEGPVMMMVDGKVLEPFRDYKIWQFTKSYNGMANILRFDINDLSDSAKIADFCAKNADVLWYSFVYLDNTKLDKKKLEKAGEEATKAMNQAIRKLNMENPFHSAGILCGVSSLPIWSFNGSDLKRDYSMVYVLADKISKSTKSFALKVNNRFHNHKTQNVCGMIRGEVEPDTMLVFTAHYDHIGQMGDGVVIGGANDNASGSAAILDIARHYKENHPHYTMVFLLLSGEEAGIRGAFHFTKNPPIDLTKIKFVINLDCFSSGEEGITVVNSTEGITKTYFDEMIRINEANHYLSVIKPRQQTYNSDHCAFSMQNVPAVFIYAMGKSGAYHDITDNYENTLFSAYDGSVKLLLDLIERLPKL